MHHAQIREHFGFTPPDDFHLFWEFARSHQPGAPQDAFNSLVGISLVGPFDVLAGRFAKETPRYDPALHWRYFGDPPEFVTILTGGTDGLHWGYVTKEPNSAPIGIAGYYAYDDVTLFQASPSPWGVLRSELESTLQQVREDTEYDPELANDEDTQTQVKLCRQLLDQIASFCSKHRVRISDSAPRAFIEHCNPPSPFPFPEIEDFPKLPALVENGIRQLVASGASERDAQLQFGRFLWHWHHDGNPLIEQCAFSLLDSAYATQDNAFLQRVLRQHRDHRHRPSLDVFDD